MVQGIARWGTEFVVGSNVALDPASVAGLGPSDGTTGRFVIVYGQGTTDSAGIGDTLGIVAQIYNADGSPHGSPFRINDITDQAQYNPVIVDRVDGQGFAVAWTDESRKPDNFGGDIRMRLFDFDGIADPGGSFIVHETDKQFDNEIQPSIDRIGTTGTIFVAYDNQVGAGNEGMGVYGRAFSNGTPLTGNIPVTAASTPPGETNTEGQANVTDIPTTGFLVTWADSIDAGQINGSGKAIRGRLYSQTGKVLGPEFTVATSEGFNLREPAAAAFADGSFIVGWTSDDDSGGTFDRNVYARIFSPSGAGGEPFLVHQDSAGQQLNLSLTPFGPDKVIAVWLHQTGARANIHVRMFRSDGTPFSDEMIVETGFATHSSVLPSVAVLQEGSGGRFVVTWRDNSTSTVNAQIFDVAQGKSGIDFYGSDRPEAYTARSFGDPLYSDEHVLYGNGGNDTLTGSAGDDELRGGTGGDSMIGGNGKDRYFVDNANDKTVETNPDAATGGIDTVFSTLNHTLGANLEILRLQGNGNLNGHGNELNNKLYGTSGANLLRGFAGADGVEGKDGSDTLDGGEGNDTLTGGGHADVFRFAKTDAGVDTITDFSRNFDRFDLSGGSFSAVSTAPNGDTVLTHNGGAIRIQHAPNLTLAQWNALVLPAGGGADMPIAAHAAQTSEAGVHTLAAQNDIVHLGRGEWLYV